MDHAAGLPRADLRVARDCTTTQACEARCEHITTLPKEELVEGPLGDALSEHRLRQLERAVLIAIGVPLHE